MKSNPACAEETITALRTERSAVAARLDAIDLALDNLRRLYPESTPAPARHQRRAPASEAATLRRMAIMTAIRQSADGGLTIRQLKAATSTMDGKARSNALMILKAAKQIRRVRGRWLAVGRPS